MYNAALAPVGNGACGVIFTVNPPSPVTLQNGPWIEVVDLGGAPKFLTMIETAQPGNSEPPDYEDVQVYQQVQQG